MASPARCSACRGGIDSALVAAIAVDALGAGSRLGRVAALALHRRHVERRRAVPKPQLLGIRYSTLPIEPAFKSFHAHAGGDVRGPKAATSPRRTCSRACRGVLLMALSNKFGHIVLTTGNKSEMAVGYATLYGDMCGGFAPIKDVYKTLVYRLARYRNSSGRGDSASA